MSFGLAAVTVRHGGLTAVREVTLPVPAGAVTAVVGGDGAGKTTVLRALVGQVAPASGTVSAPQPERIGYLPATAGSWAELSVWENLEFVGAAYGVTGVELRRRGDQLLERAGLTGARHRLARQLSGGMRRKLGFCLAMLAEPRLLVLDEPSTGVDPVSRVELWRLVAAAAAAGTAVLMSTTYLDEAERCASLAVLDGGEVLAAGTPPQVLAGLDGTVVSVPAPTHPRRAWRRGRQFREWWPPGETPAAGTPVVPDLEDAVVVMSLRRGAAVTP